ncbi:MAG: methionine ABC transporter ATP-binding protein [Oscillospiraceae bacterium]
MIELKHICKTFDSGGGEVEALKDVSLTIEKGEIYGIIGMSGAGKSTLVRCMNLLERPTSGEIWVNGQELEKMTPKELRRARGEITMIFQHFNLLMQRTCLRNVCFPMELGGMKKADSEKRARELLDLVGLPDKANAYPAQLSGGQRCKPLPFSHQPWCRRDEATSALDPNTTHQILQLIRELNRELGITVVIITHQMSVVKEICDKVAILDGGEVAEEGLVSAVFAAPKSAAGRRLVFPSGADALVSDPASERRVRLIFRDSQTTGIPLVARLAAEESVYCNVISASTQRLSREVYGSMLLGIPSGQFDRAVDFIKAYPNIQVEEVEHNVQ